MVVVCCIVNYLFCYVDVNSECLCIFSGEPENVSSYQNFAICDHTVLYDGPNPKRWRWTCVKKEYLVIKTLLFVISWMGSADRFSG